MEACEVFEIDANSPAAIPEKRTYMVEDIQVILGISRGTAYKLLEKRNFAGSRSAAPIVSPRRALMTGLII